MVAMDRIMQLLYQMVQMSILNQYEDSSMLRRRPLIGMRSEKVMRTEFLKKMNGIVFDKEFDSVDTVIFSAFLDERCVSYIETFPREEKILLITHHFFDMDCGTPGKNNGRTFSFLEYERLIRLYDRNVQICSIHLPLDVNSSRINTHAALCRKVWKMTGRDLLKYSFGNMGYEIEGVQLIPPEKEFHQIAEYGCGANPAHNKIAVVSGVISNAEMLQTMVRRGCGVCICGDVLVRNQSERTREMEKFLNTLPMSVYCISHYQSEIPALEEMAMELKAIPEVRVIVMKEEELWK